MDDYLLKERMRLESMARQETLKANETRNLALKSLACAMGSIVLMLPHWINAAGANPVQAETTMAVLGSIISYFSGMLLRMVSEYFLIRTLTE